MLKLKEASPYSGDEVCGEAKREDGCGGATQSRPDVLDRVQAAPDSPDGYGGAGGQRALAERPLIG